MAKISVPKGQRLTISLADLEIVKVMVNGRRFDLEEAADPTELEVAGSLIEIEYEGVFQDLDGNIIAQEGIILRDIWYPVVSGRCLYTLTAILPPDYEAVSEADRIIKSLGEGTATFRFEFPHPLNDSDGLTFAASPRFQISRTGYRDIELSTYFFPEHAGLAELYLDQARQFLETYERLLGPYPYRRFSLVESIQPSAYSMPTYILLGEREIGSDDYARSLLAHEILHQWFGNTVFTNFEQGNWNEGLTIYLADHFLEEKRNAGWQCRRCILSNFKTYVNPRDEIPLRKFSEREDDVTRSVGYGKSAMVFHMLRRQVGEEHFWAGIKDFVRQHSFRAASWDDIRKTLERRTNQDLSWFFAQWLNGLGLPEIRVENVRIEPGGKYFRAAVTLSQKGPLMKLQVPLTFYRAQVPQHFTVTLSKRKETFFFKLDSRPEELVLDENFDVFRKLTDTEDPPTFKRLVAARSKLIVPPPLPPDISEEVIKAFKQRGVSLKIAKVEFNGSLEQNSGAVLLLGRDHPLIPSLFGDLKIDNSGVHMAIRKHPHFPQRLVAVFHARGQEEVKAALEEMFNRQFFSDYVFRHGKLVSRTLEEAERGIRIKLAGPMPKTTDH